MTASSASGRSSSSAAARITIPTIAAEVAASRITVVAARHARPPDTIHRAAHRAERREGWCGSRRGREKIAERNGASTPTSAASSPPPTAIAMLCQLTIRCGPDGKGEREVAGVGLEQRDRQQIAEGEPDAAGDDAEHERVEQQHLDDHPARVAVEAQILDQLPALRDRQQQRVEREQEADERADRREQAGRLVRRAGRAVEAALR